MDCRCIIDISEAAGKGFLVKFTASGVNSGDINSWLVDNIHIYAVCKGAQDLQALVSGFNVDLSWSPPDCTGGMMDLDEGFEEESFPPPGWSQVITDAYSTWSHMNGNSPVGTYEGNYSAGVLWDYNHQDEWLIAEDVNVDGDLQFWSYAFQGSIHSDHYYVKVSSDNGNTWSILLDMSALPPYNSPSGYNQWNEPYLVDMSAFYGHVVQIAWQAVDGDGQGLWYSWAVDNCYVGSKKLSLTAFSNRNLLGYDVYRQDGPGMDFHKVTLNPVMDTTYTDITHTDGHYSYFITTIFAECSQSMTSDTVVAEVLTGIPNPESRQTKLYPNPATGTFTVMSTDPLLKVDLMDASGALIRNMKINGETSVIIDVSGLRQGMYLVRITTREGQVTRKVTVLKY